MDLVYLDRHQCDKFEVPYMFEDGEIVVRAQALLASKFNGYDNQHVKFLQSFGNGLIRLIRRDEVDPPGWFRPSRA